jgi:hypothetical protein
MKAEENAWDSDKLKMVESRINSRPGPRGRSARYSARLASVLAIFACLLASCGDGETRDPVAEMGNPNVPNAPALSAVPRTSTEIFPATGRRGLVLNNCASCHAVACAAVGRRSASEWSAVEASHTNYIPGLSIEDRGKIFDYLHEYFNDTLPEPVVPPELLQGGCPTFNSASPAPPATEPLSSP